MSTHLYAFGSICRGEIDKSSDIDLLACLSEPDPGIDSRRFSIYSHQRIRELWAEGNPFAWHLHLESKLLYSSTGEDFINSLGRPAPYSKSVEDCEKFRSLFLQSLNSLTAETNSPTFDISCMFLATRNFATCYSLGSGNPVFSRYSPLLIDDRLVISKSEFDVYVRARILSTRGYGEPLSNSDIDRAKESAHSVVEWMSELADDYLSPELRYERV
jgi:hypothetical protein